MFYLTFIGIMNGMLENLRASFLIPICVRAATIPMDTRLERKFFFIEEVIGILDFRVFYF